MSPNQHLSHESGVTKDQNNSTCVITLWKIVRTKVFLYEAYDFDSFPLPYQHVNLKLLNTKDTHFNVRVLETKRILALNQTKVL